MKVISFCILFILLSFKIYSQDSDQNINKVIRSVVYIYGQSPVIKKLDDGQYVEIWTRSASQKSPVKSMKNMAGSGFIVIYEKQGFLVTAKHVANDCIENMHIMVSSKSGKPYDLLFNDLIGHEPHGWVFSDSTDLAVHLIFPSKVFFDSTDLLHLTPAVIKSELSSVDRNSEITVAGFPRNFGIGEDFSPISMTSRVASDLVNIPDFNNPVILLSDPSVQGYSGGPVFKTSNISYSKKFITVDNSIQLIGLMSGTVPDDTGGKMGVVIPSYFILETLKKARRFNCIEIIKYPNGKIWSRVEFKNGFCWNVLENFDPNGKPQNKGTLMNGNGSVMLYDELGTLMTIENYVNGVLVDSVNK